MADTPPTRQDEHDARVVSAHLPSGYGAAFDGTSEEGAQPATPPRTSSIDMAPNQEESSLKLQGGDIHRALYKIDHRAKLHKRAATFSGPRNNALLDEDDQLTAQEQLLPGGFRRAFVMQRRQDFVAARMPVTRNFVEFLDLYGSFAGEDLADSDDDETEDSEDADAEGQDERRPLLTKRQSAFRAKQGDASTTKTFFTLLKAFIGTGIMFLPKAFNNGGILFSSMCLVSISMISMLAFHLLLECRNRYGGGYGDIGNSIGGSKMRAVILGSITLSQLGFVCAGIVFCAENFYSFSEAVARGTSPVSTRLLIAIQLVVLIPFSFIRNISKLGPAALLADIFIAVGLVYIYWYDISTLADRGLNPTVQLFNPAHYTLTIGSCIFTFEGIGLILPIQSSMSKPQKFEPLLALVMLLITVVFCSVGALCYATFGNDTNIEIINNFPQTSKLVNAVQFLYSIAVLVGNPVQLFPAVRIIEGKLFGHRSGKKDTPTKWKKNGLRTSLVILCGAVSIVGAGNLDRFVALIGSFACVPLVYIYPPLLHYKGIAGDKKHALWWKIGDGILMGLGVVGMIYTTAVTVANSFM